MTDAPFASKLVAVTLDETSIGRSGPDIEHERAVAIYDLIEENAFQPVDQEAGPYALHLSMADNRLVFDIRGEFGDPIGKVMLALGPFRRVVKDYFTVCESYYAAIKTSSPSQIEAIDMGRRGLHNEGAELLKERLAGKIDVDENTARRLFTLICVLHIRG